GAHVEAVEQAFEGRCLAPIVGRERVVGPAIGVGRLDQAELADIARDGGLGDVESPVHEEFTERLLAGHAVFGQDGEDGGMAVALAHIGRGWSWCAAASRAKRRAWASILADRGASRRFGGGVLPGATGGRRAGAD